MLEHVRTLARGVEAGLVAGGVVVAVFFIADLVHLAPLSTPLSLQRSFIGPGGTPLDFPVLAQISGAATFVVRLGSFTLLHFLAFAGLGVGAALLFERGVMPAGVLTGALYGAVASSAVFYVAVMVAGNGLVVEPPDAAGVVGANVLAGGVMGGYLRAAAAMDEEEGKPREAAGPA